MVRNCFYRMHHRQISEAVDIKKSHQWLKEAELKGNIKALIIGAKEQTVQHTAAGCKIPTGTIYTEKHNQITGIIYRNIFSTYDLDSSKIGYDVPQKIG